MRSLCHMVVVSGLSLAQEGAEFEYTFVFALSFMQLPDD
jgi:hypothetical protein